MTPRYSAVQHFYTNASQPSYLPAYTTDTLRAVIWLQRRWPKAFPAFMTHATQKLFRSHNTPISQCFSQHKPPSYVPVYATDTIHVCIQLQRAWPKAFPKALLLLPSVLYSIIMSHIHIIIHTTYILRAIHRIFPHLCILLLWHITYITVDTLWSII